MPPLPLGNVDTANLAQGGAASMRSQRGGVEGSGGGPAWWQRHQRTLSAVDGSETARGRRQAPLVLPGGSAVFMADENEV